MLSRSVFRLFVRRHREFLRFCVVGGVCTLLDAFIFYVLNLLTGIYQLALVCGYVLSLVLNYFMTIYWTFGVKATAGNAVGVVAAHLFNLFVVRMGLMAMMVGCAGMDARVAYLPVVCVSVLTNFYIIRRVVRLFR